MLTILFFTFFGFHVVNGQLPPYPQTYKLNESTIIMPCNNSGFTNPASTAGWKYVDFDWSNAKSIWFVSRFYFNCLLWKEFFLLIFLCLFFFFFF
jgi:hypothetical protein